MKNSNLSSFFTRLMAISFFVLITINASAQFNPCGTCTPPCDWNIDVQTSGCPTWYIEFDYLNCPDYRMPYGSTSGSVNLCQSCDGGCECPLGVRIAGEYIPLTGGGGTWSFPNPMDCYPDPGFPYNYPVCPNGWEVTVSGNTIKIECLP